MKRPLKTLLALAALALLGLLAGVALTGTSPAASATDPGTATSTAADTTTGPTVEPPATTTDSATTAETTAPGTTTAPETTTSAPATTTAPETTTAAATTAAAPTTTAAASTGGGGVTQSTPQSSTGSGTTTTGTQTQPCQTPSNPGVTCGNNAATQLAVVTQNCKSDATVAAPGVRIDIVNPDGSIAKSVGIENSSICLNYAQITQIVNQICIHCTLVVQNYYHYTTNNNTTVQGWNGPHYVGYCMPADRPMQRGDGTVGWLVFVEDGRPGWDPAYKGATRAQFDPANGYTCPGTASAAVPNTFTLTVPAAFVGQYVNLCLQPADPRAKPVCHSLKIDGSSRFTIPVSSSIRASITKLPKAKVVSRKATDAAAGLIAPKAKKACTAKVKSKITTKKLCAAGKKVTQKQKRRAKT